MAKVIVFSPVTGFNGVSVGVAFTDGHALVEEDSAAYRYFKRRGYRIGEQVLDDGEDPDTVISSAFKEADGDTGESGEGDTPNEPAESPEIDIPGMPKADATRGQFAEFAEGMGIDTEGLTKAQIVEAIKAEVAE